MNLNEATPIIHEAQKKLRKINLLKTELTSEQLTIALHYFTTNISNHDSVIQKANIALLSVINVHVDGGILPTVFTAWGKILGGMSYQPGMAKTITTAANHNEPQLSPEQKNIIDTIKLSRVNPDFIRKLSAKVTANGLNLDPSSSPASDESSSGANQGSTIAPRLVGAANPYSPFATGTKIIDEEKDKN